MKKSRGAMAVIPEGVPYKQCWFSCKQTFSFSSSSKTHQLLISFSWHISSLKPVSNFSLYENLKTHQKIRMPLSVPLFLFSVLFLVSGSSLTQLSPKIFSNELESLLLAITLSLFMLKPSQPRSIPILPIALHSNQSLIISSLLTPFLFSVLYN